MVVVVVDVVVVVVRLVVAPLLAGTDDVESVEATVACVPRVVVVVGTVAHVSVALLWCRSTPCGYDVIAWITPQRLRNVMSASP